MGIVLEQINAREDRKDPSCNSEPSAVIHHGITFRRPLHHCSQGNLHTSTLVTTENRKEMCDNIATIELGYPSALQLSLLDRGFRTATHLGLGGPLFFTASAFAISMTFLFLFLLFTFISILVFPVCASGDPESTLAILQRLVLTGQVNTLTLVALTICPALGQIAGTSTELGGNGGILGDPVGESILAVLNNPRCRLAWADVHKKYSINRARTLC